MTVTEAPAAHTIDDAPRPPATFIPTRDDTMPTVSARRSFGGVSRDELVNISGAFVSAVSTSLLIFTQLTSLSGPLGFVAATYAVFLVTYAYLVSLSDGRPVVVDKVMSVLFATASAIAGIALLSVITFTLFRGRAALTKTNLYWKDMSEAGPADPLSVGGIGHAILGTLLIISIAIAITVPLGITCALFLNESRGRLTQLVRTVIDAMTALPSILAGLFIFATWILILGFGRSGLAAALAVSVMMLPIIIRSADVVLRLVPGNLKEASAALGAPQWRTVRHVVLPTARSGLATAVILGVARGVGETAPVLLTAGFTSAFNVDPLKNPMVSLPLATFEFVRSPQPALVARGFATAAVLMVVVLVLFAITRVLGGHPAGHVTGRQARRLAARSKQDVARFDTTRPEVVR